MAQSYSFFPTVLNSALFIPKPSMLGFELSVQTVFVLMQPLSQIKRGDKELQGNNYVK